MTTWPLTDIDPFVLIELTHGMRSCFVCDEEEGKAG